MFRLWLVILSLFTKHFSRDVFIMASVSHETCSAPKQRCGAKLSYPKLVRLDGVQVRQNMIIKCLGLEHLFAVFLTFLISSDWPRSEYETD